MSDEVIVANQLSKAYQSHEVLKSLDFTIKRGQILGLLGPNGAGKTTLLKTILGLTPYQGKLSVLNFSPARQRVAMMQHMCFIADVAILPRWLTANQAVKFLSGVHPKFNIDKAKKFLKQTEVPLDAKVGTLSKGMIVQLHLALVMAIDVEILVLDEPTLGLDIIYRKTFYRSLLEDYYNEHRTIIITTHQIEEIENILTDLMMIVGGRIKLYDSMENIDARFVLVKSKPDANKRLESLKPITSYHQLGYQWYLFENINKEQLQEFGELSTPSVSEIFLAKVTGEKQS